MNDNKPIYLQIADSLMDGIVAGSYRADCRMPSVREMAAQCQVNINTVLRSYEQLERDGIIYNKRGLGYFVSTNAVELIINLRREQFYKVEADYFFSRLRQMGVTPDALKAQYEEYLQK